MPISWKVDANHEEGAYEPRESVHTEALSILSAGSS